MCLQDFFGHDLDYDRFGMWGPTDLIDEGLLQLERVEERGDWTMRVSETVLAMSLIVIRDRLAGVVFRLVAQHERVPIRVLLRHTVRVCPLVVVRVFR